MKTRNTPSTTQSSTHTAPVAFKVKTYDPNCFEGDICDLAQSAGNVPLDGVGGRPLVIAPMIQDIVLRAKNSWREPIRAADFVMPKVVLLTFQPDEFTPDSNHPWAGSYTLSPEFYEALANNGRPHVVTYLGTAHGGSRHWHHTRWTGSGAGGWGQATPSATNVRRHVWRAQITYYPNGDVTARTLEIRFVMEHTVNPEPLLTPVGGGGKQNRTECAWGSIFMIYVFTDELNPSFVDGNSYTPIGASGAVSFTRDNPCRWGAVDSLPGGDTGDRFVHPQMAICASIPTSFESPFEYLWIPPEDRLSFGGFEGANRSCFYKCANDSPWLPGGCTEAAYQGGKHFYNTVFGYGGASHNWAAYTPGGDFPRSKPIEYVVIENGLGVGRTYLKPKRPGWDEVCGRLDLINGSSISIKLCSDDKYGIDGRWPRYEPDSCKGHPDEPFEDVGGSHSCFYNGNPDINCCIQFEDAFAYSNEYCLLDLTFYGDFDGSNCEIKDTKCYIQGVFATRLTCKLYDYTYNMNGSQDARIITWKNFKQDPDQVLYDFTYAGVSDVKLVSKRGSWSQTATIDVTGAGGSGPVRSFLQYEPAGEIYHGSISARGKKCDLQDHRIIFRSHYTSGQLTGYCLAVTPTGGSNATIKFSKVIADVETTIYSKNITNNNALMTIRAEWLGCRFYLYVDTPTEPVLLLEIYDTSIDGTGYMGLGSSANSTNVQFDQVFFDDRTKTHVDSQIQLAFESVSVDIHTKAAAGYTSGCGTTNEPGCGTPPPNGRCNCTSATTTLYSQLTASSGPGDVTLPNCHTDVDGNCEGTSGTNPGPVDGGIPECDCCGRYKTQGGTQHPPCSSCPPPRVSVGCYIPKRCLPKTGMVEGKMCSGIKYWEWSPIVEA